MTTPASSKLSRLSAESLSSNPRCTERAWRRFEEVVQTAFSQRPHPYVFSPTGLSIESTVSKLRDAVRGKLVFDYASSVSAEALTPWWAETVVRRQGEHVYIGPPDKKDFEPLAPKPEGLVFEMLSENELNAFCLLLNNGKLQGPIVVKSGWTCLPLPYSNVECIRKPNGSITLL